MIEKPSGIVEPSLRSGYYKFVWTVALLVTIVMVIIILMMHVARKNMSGTIEPALWAYF